MGGGIGMYNIPQTTQGYVDMNYEGGKSTDIT